MSLLDAMLLDPYPVEVWVAYRTDGIKGNGTLNSPWDASTDTKFDAIMNGLPANTPVRVHLGPTPRDSNNDPIPFKTKGFWINSNGTTGSAWQAKANMAIVGSGFDVTVLQLTGTTLADAHYFAIGAPTTAPTHFLEVSDLTIDSNLPSDGSAACGAIRVMGNHIRVRRVKCVNWGSRTTVYPSFVIALIIADPDTGSPLLAVDNAVIEDCIAVEPSYNNVSGAKVNIFHVGGRERANTTLTDFGRGPVIRNCFIDCAASPAILAELRGLSMGGCHGGVVEGNQAHNVAIGGPYQEKLNTREIIVRNNTYRNVNRGPFWNLGATSSIGVQKLLVEGNHIQLMTGTPSPTPIGIYVHDNGIASPPYVHGQVVIRNNKIRYVDSTPGSFNGYGVHVNGASALLMFDNVLELTPANPLRNQRCGSVKYFNNQTPGGTLLLGWEDTLDFKYGELATEAEDAFVLGLLEKR